MGSKQFYTKSVSKLESWRTKKVDILYLLILSVIYTYYYHGGIIVKVVYLSCIMRTQESNLVTNKSPGLVVKSEKSVKH